MPVKPDGPSKISLACNLGWKTFLCSQNFIFKKKLKKKKTPLILSHSFHQVIAKECFHMLTSLALAHREAGRNFSVSGFRSGTGFGHAADNSFLG